MGSPAQLKQEEEEIITPDVKIPIVGFEICEERERFTVFKLRIENEKLGRDWLVFRRYTDFVRLHTKLKEEYPTLNIPLPPKRWLRDNFELAFLEDRMKVLQSFVDTILLLQPNLTQSPIVREFFCLDEPPTYPQCSSEESKSMFGTVEENIIHLKQQLAERDLECELLKTELAIVTTQRDSLLKTTKSCRHCSQRLSIITSSSPISEVPNHRSTSSMSGKKTLPRNDNRNRNSSSSASSLTSTSNENSVNSSPKTRSPKTSTPKPSSSKSIDSFKEVSSLNQSEPSQSVIESGANESSCIVLDATTQNSDACKNI